MLVFANEGLGAEELGYKLGFLKFLSLSVNRRTMIGLLFNKLYFFSVLLGTPVRALASNKKVFHELKIFSVSQKPSDQSRNQP